MLSYVLKAIEFLQFKENQVKLLEGVLFLKDGALSNVSFGVRKFLLMDRRSRYNENYMDIVRQNVSGCQYYLIEDGRVWNGYILSCPENLKSKIPVSKGKLLSGLEHIISGDPIVKQNKGIKVLDAGKYVAEFDYGNSKLLVSRKAFARFVRNHRGNNPITLRECLFDLYRFVKKADAIENKPISKLRVKLADLYTKTREGKKTPLLDNREAQYLYYSGNRSWIFVRQDNEIKYCEPNF